MVSCANAASRADEDGSNGITDPHTKPCLPPRKSTNNHGRRDHPRVDVEGICNPKTDKVPGTPLAARRLDGLQVVVRQLPKGGVRELAPVGSSQVGRLQGASRTWFNTWRSKSLFAPSTGHSSGPAQLRRPACRQTSSTSHRRWASPRPWCWDPSKGLARWVAG